MYELYILIYIFTSKLKLTLIMQNVKCIVFHLRKIVVIGSRIMTLNFCDNIYTIWVIKRIRRWEYTPIIYENKQHITNGLRKIERFLIKWSFVVNSSFVFLFVCLFIIL